MPVFTEQLYPSWRQTFTQDRILFENRTDHQHLVIFEADGFGAVMALDGIVQVTTRDEFMYHEMLTHVPLLAFGAPKRVLIVGGGDGGILREVLKHPVDEAVMVEIDQAVIDMCREYLPSISAGAFDDPRARVVIGDGRAFMAEGADTFDVIIVDSTDPIGPGEVLFEGGFYADCKRRLNPGGILVTQNGVPFMQAPEITTTWRRLSAHFGDVTFYVVPVPTYVGGFMTLAWGCDEPAKRALPLHEIEARMAAAVLAGKTRYHTAAIQQGCFALPQYIQDLLVA